MSRAELICLTKIGISRVRITTTSETMVSTQVIPLSVPKTGDHSLWKSTIRPETAQ